jgi:hypothetical protein
VNPFGLKNLRTVFGVQADKAWLYINEWRSLLDPLPGMRSWPWLSLAGLLVVSTVWRGLRRGEQTRAQLMAAGMLLFSGAAVLAAWATLDITQLPKRDDVDLAQNFRAACGAGAALLVIGLYLLWRMREHLASSVRHDPDAQDTARRVMSILMVSATVAMAIKSFRFVAISAVFIGPLLAWNLSGIVAQARGRLAAIARLTMAFLPVVLAIIATSVAWPVLWPQNPFMPGPSLMHRVHLPASQFDPELTAFVNRHGLAGRTLADYSQAGYIRWQCPSIRVFIDGRAQQVYDGQRLKIWMQIQNGQRLPTPPPVSATYVMFTLNKHNNGMLKRCRSENSPLRTVFDNGRSVIMVDASTTNLPEQVKVLIADPEDDRSSIPVETWALRAERQGVSGEEICRRLNLAADKWESRLAKASTPTEELHRLRQLARIMYLLTVQNIIIGDDPAADRADQRWQEIIRRIEALAEEWSLW